MSFWVGFAQDPQDIVRKSIDAVSFQGFELKTTLFIYDNKGNQRQRTVLTSSIQNGDVTKTVSKFIAPAEVSGTSILIHDYDNKPADMWIYLPSTRKVRRIAGSERKGSFMGSEFTNGNLSRPDMKEYAYKLLGSENHGGKDCYKIEITGKTPEIAKMDGYFKQNSWIDKSLNLCLKTSYYDQKGKLLKTQLFKDYKKQANGKFFCYIMEMKNEVNGRSSIIDTKSFSIGSGKKDKAFAPVSFME